MSMIKPLTLGNLVEIIVAPDKKPDRETQSGINFA
jgi:hypothetical protein